MVQEEIKINNVPDELYNLTQLAEVTLAAGKLSTTNINQIKNYIQQKTICSYDDFSNGVATGGYHDGYFTLPAATSAPSTAANTTMSSLYRDDVKKLTDLDEYKINLKSPPPPEPINVPIILAAPVNSGVETGADFNKNAWIENNFENLFTNYLDNRDGRNIHPQHSVIKYEKKYKLGGSNNNTTNYDACNYNSNSNGSNNSLDSNDDFDKKHNLHISSRSPSLSSPLSTSSPNFVSSYDRERKNFIYSHKIFDRKKSRNLILIDEDEERKEVGHGNSGGGGGAEITWKHNNSDSNDILSKSSSSSSVSSVNHNHHHHRHHQHGGSVVVDGALCQLDHSSSGSSIGANDKNGGLQLDEPHICPECGKKYSTSSNLARHRQTHRSLQDKKARKCEFCDKVYVSMPAYSMHVRTHNQGCKCSHCGKCFSRPWLLQGHIRTHTGEKPFKCSICPKAFADKSNLRAHIQTHSNTKPHSCVRCGKAFALKSYLYKHEESSCMKNHSRGNTSGGGGGGGNNTNSDGDTNNNNNRSNEYRPKNLLERRIKKSRKIILINSSSSNINNDDELLNKYTSKSDESNLPAGQTTENLPSTESESNKLILKLKESNFLRTSVIRKTVSGKTLNSFNNFAPAYHDVHPHHHHHNHHHHQHHHEYHQQQDLVMG